MATYLTTFTQSAQAWAHLVAHPEDRRETLAPLLESVGGRLIDLWYAFGEIDGVVLFEAPDDVAAACVLSVVAAGGSVTGIQTTRLVRVEDMLEAWRRAGAASYRPPGTSSA